MKVGFLQFKPVFGEVIRNFNRVSKMLEGVEADLIVLPELFTTGFNFIDNIEARSYAEPFKGGSTHEFMKGIAREKKCAFVAGFLEESNGKVYNSLMFVPPEGEDVLYRKLHLFDKGKKLFTPGDIPLSPVKYKGVKLGFLICFDWIFPETFRTLALKGAQVICHCTNLVLPFYPQAALVRAVENGVFIVYSNRTGAENRGGVNLKFIGMSRIISPRGEILVEADQTEETVKIIEIDPKEALDKNITKYNHVLKDRRTEFYDLD
ncbi:hypothetical protein JXI42_06910 [bacterium]|nr:hypothetical protein [bacterium]